MSTRADEEDPRVGFVAVLFAVGFVAALAYLRATYPSPGLGALTPSGALWAALFCTQVAAWVVVTVLSVKSIRDLNRREPLNTVVPIARIVAVVIVLAGTCLLIFETFLDSAAVRRALDNVSPDPGLRRAFAGLGLPVAATSYVPLMIVGGALLITHAALQRLVGGADALHLQVSRLRDFGSRLRMLLFGATLLVGLSSASAVMLNVARGNALGEQYFWIHGALYSMLLALLYIPAHVTLVQKARAVAERMCPPGNAGSEAGLLQEGRQQVEADMGVQLSGMPGWDVVTSILIPLATALLG